MNGQTLFVVSLGLFSCFIIVDGCTKAAVERCMEPITGLRKQLGIPDDMEYFPLYSLDDQGFSDYCRAGQSMGQCLKTLHGCSEIDRKIVGGISDSVDYICDEVMEEYKKYQPCYASKSVLSKLQGCLDKHKSKIEHSSFEDIQKTVCQVLHDQVPCVRDAIEPSCGTPAAELQITYVKKVLDPIAHAIGCNEWSLWKKVLIFGAIGLAISIFALCIKYAIVCCRNKNNKSRNNQGQVLFQQQQVGYAPAPNNPPSIYLPPLNNPPPAGYMQPANMQPPPGYTQPAMNQPPPQYSDTVVNPHYYPVSNQGYPPATQPDYFHGNEEKKYPPL